VTLRGSDVPAVSGFPDQGGNFPESPDLIPCKAAINSLNSLFGCVGNWPVGLWIDAYEISGEALPFFSLWSCWLR
jgi:hypothetical protein